MPNTTRRGRRVVGLAAGGFGLLWLVGVWGGPSRVLPMGDELSFCGLDCHLHVAVVGLKRGADVGVTLRFRSDAKAAKERPGDLAIEVIDSAGRSYAPTSGTITEQLAAGAVLEREYRFAIPRGADPVALVAHYNGLMDYLVPGSGNPLAQRRIRLSLVGADGGA